MAEDGGAPEVGTLINGRFRPTKKLGSGSFGEIYMGVGPNGEKVAIKFEKAGLRCPQLRHEYKVYRELSGSVGIGRVHHYGTYGSSNVMVMDLLGASLEDLFTRCGRRFSLKTTLKLADQLLERVDAIHARHLIHRDIKPANFVMQSDTGELCFCIDFGLSKRYRNPHTLAHIPHRVGKSLTGTPRYASINNHLGIEQARRDDLEAIGYVLIYFLKGRLPWQGLKARNASRKYKMIMEKKQSTSINTLCAGCPKEFAEYLSYCRSLKFEAAPNIKYLRQLFKDLYIQQGYDPNSYGDNDWDWNRISEAQQPSSNSAAARQSDTGAPSAVAAQDTDARLAAKQPSALATNAKPYGMYGQAAADAAGTTGVYEQSTTGGTATGQSANYGRPSTAGAYAGSVGDTRPDSANRLPSATANYGAPPGRAWSGGSAGAGSSGRPGRPTSAPRSGTAGGGGDPYVVGSKNRTYSREKPRSGSGGQAGGRVPYGSGGQDPPATRPLSAGYVGRQSGQRGVPSGGSTGNASGGRQRGGSSRNAYQTYRRASGH